MTASGDLTLEQLRKQLEKSEAGRAKLRESLVQPPAAEQQQGMEPDSPRKHACALRAQVSHAACGQAIYAVVALFSTQM